MAMYRIGSTRKYTGLSTDTKPSVDVEYGDEFYETDTGRRYIYIGTWTQVLNNKVKSFIKGVTMASGVTTATFSFVHSGYINLVGAVAATTASATSITLALSDENNVPIYSQDKIPINTETAYHLADKYLPCDGKVSGLATLATATGGTPSETAASATFVFYVE